MSGRTTWVDAIVRHVTGRFSDNVSARIRQTGSGEFGHLRLWGFDLADDEGFIDEVIDILDRLPQEGLVIDLRANPGGLIWAAERLLQLFTPRQWNRAASRSWPPKLPGNWPR